MRYFYLESSIYGVDENQYTEDEILQNGFSHMPCAPSGAIDVTEYEEDIKSYSLTHAASIVDGVLTWTEKTSTMSDEEITLARKAAYSNPLTGSDSLYIEYQAMLALDSDSADEAKQAWLTRREEIKEEYPL